ncbi:hypothetical protein CLV46_1175 [Diaminobutyricimonas aerilata]|uniref:UPF0182 protein CLV46_1175 n=1 Tax=Diaminobutyricimonas aerilata TaxID=1162967 RepID=A0A2M9CIE4_9MICO|nr:hypothetical protein CLV46_1175 [Diaminobutyricimonas aerilata]
MLAVIVIGFFIFASLYTDVLWYEQVDYLGVLLTQWGAQAAMFGVGFLGMALPVWASLFIAFRFRPMYAKLNSQLDRYQQVVEPLRRVAMLGIPIVLGLFAGVSTASRWPVVLQWLNRTPFGETDPQFGLDISFYVFELPFYHGVVGFASAVVLLCAVGALATSYLYGALRVNGREVRISRTARIQLAVTGAIYLALQAVSLWLDQYTTLYSSHEGFLETGAGYTVANATIPSRAILAGVAALVAILFIVTAVIGRWRLPIIGTALLLVTSLLIGSVYPWIVQRFQVEPSAQTLEEEYIQRNIDATRAAYNVDGVEEQPYNATTDATAGALREDAETTANIRIVDPALVSDTFRQLEQVRQFYQFPEYLDVDRYEIDGATQDTVIALRELNQEGQSSRGWLNDHIIYTHGYGVVAAYGNQRADDGEPVFLESGIPLSGGLGEFEPRIYFGETSPEYSIVGADEGANAREIDYPTAGEDESESPRFTFDGDGGPKLDNVFKRLLYALKFQSEQIFLSDAVNDQSQILYDRDPATRIQKVAPYLTLDNDPYPAVVDGKIVWIVDAYTTSANYPYSDTNSLSETIADTYQPRPNFPLDNINYIRNSVKATVDAYDGTVTLYAWDDQDPVLKTWQKIFPSTLEPMSEMSDQLLDHVRYPADLFKVQRSVLERYHVDTANSFYQGNEAWSTPNDPTASSSNPTLQPPYYLTMQVPGTEQPAFTLYSTFIPNNSGQNARNVLTGYLTANSDPGEDYGKLTMLTLPEGQVPGPGQVFNTFSSDTEVANQLALLERGNTEVRRGNLLTLPVGGGLLYVQPVYVRATGESGYPLLRKVLVAFGNDIAFEDTLDQALDTLFGGDSGADAGDTDVEPTDPEDQPGAEEPPAEEPPAEEPGTETPPAEEPSTGGDALAQALADARQALQDREAAYARNDLVAAAQADEALQDAIERAIAASE